jgi:hypothetical protein
MATASEVLAVEQLHQAAQARLGLAAAYLSLVEWDTVSSFNAATTSAAWLTRSLRAIAAIRKMSRRLAISYYQLSRALETGRTLGVPEGSTDDDVTLGELRENFRNNALDVAALPSTETPSSDPDIRWFENTLEELDSRGEENARSIRLADVPVDPLIQNLLDVEGSDDSKSIQVDRFDWITEMTLDDVEDIFRSVLRKQAVDHMDDAVKNIRTDEDLTPDLAIGKIEVIHASAGSIGSGLVDAIGMDGGREVIADAIQKDRLVKSVARGTSSDPCHFCAMLASRGFVYRNEKSAGLSEEIEKFHVNCHCFPIVRWTRETELPELNRYFQEKWAEVTRGYSGNEARKAWRRWIYAQRKANPDAPHGARKTK